MSDESWLDKFERKQRRREIHAYSQAQKNKPGGIVERGVDRPRSKPKKNKQKRKSTAGVKRVRVTAKTAQPRAMKTPEDIRLRRQDGRYGLRNAARSEVDKDLECQAIVDILTNLNSRGFRIRRDDD